jgi:hypothetical protein
MTGKVEAIERCAYCQSYVPVTPIDVSGPSEESDALRAVVTICECCQEDGL